MSAKETLYAEMGLHLKYIALKYFGDDDIVDDVLQVFWLHIESYCKKYHYVGNGFNYLARVFDNLCKQRYRHDRRQPIMVSLDALDTIEDSLIVNDDLGLRQAALRQSFEKAAISMTPDERAVFSMLLYGEMNVRDMAAVLGFSKSKVARLRTSCMAIAKATLIHDGWDKTDI